MSNILSNIYTFFGSLWHSFWGTNTNPLPEKTTAPMEKVDPLIGTGKAPPMPHFDIPRHLSKKLYVLADSDSPSPLYTIDEAAYKLKLSREILMSMIYTTRKVRVTRSSKPYGKRLQGLNLETVRLIVIDQLQHCKRKSDRMMTYSPKGNDIPLQNFIMSRTTERGFTE